MTVILTEENTEMMYHMALLALTDAFWSEWEYKEEILNELGITEEEYDLIHYGPGTELCGYTEWLLQDLEIDIENYLPYDYIWSIINKIDKQWAEKYTFAELYEFSEAAAGHAVLLAVGHGVAPTDEPDVQDLFKELGIENPRIYVDQAEVWDLVLAIANKMIENRDAE